MKIKEPKQCAVAEPSNFSAVLAVSDSNLNLWADSREFAGPAFLQAPGRRVPVALNMRPSRTLREPSTLAHDNSTSSISENLPTTSGLRISFGKTLAFLANKTVTRRAWKDTHAKKFINAFHRNKLVKALDKDIRYGGKQIGWCRLLCAPYKEKLCDMPPSDLEAEGGMCRSIGEFVGRYFKGDSSLVVWVIRFEFIPLAVCPTSQKQTNTNPPINARSESIHQASLLRLGVCPTLENQTNTNSPILSPVESIHQTPLVPFGVYQQSEKQTNTSSPTLSRIDSIHQDSLDPLGVCPAPQKQTNTNSPILSPIESIHQAPAESIHQALLVTLGVYQPPEKQTNTNSRIHPTADSIHQAPLEALPTLDLSEFELPRNNTKSPIASATESIPQTPNEKLDGCSGGCDSSDTNPAIPTAPEITNLSPVVQGGSGLVYSFWKGESIVNHYRYKVKVNGKWKVKSIYIPVGKLPQVREAIANKLGAAAIVIEILGKQV
jgi:hypothetical protein